MANFVEQRLLIPLRNLLIGGITPQKLTLSLTAGAILGLFPVMGSTTALCALVALIFKLNLPAIQLVNYIIYPAQLALILPFIKAGQWILRSERTSMTLNQMVTSFKSNPGPALHQLWRLALAGVLAWSVFAVIAFPVFYWLLLQVVERIHREIQSRRAQPSGVA